MVVRIKSNEQTSVTHVLWVEVHPYRVVNSCSQALIHKQNETKNLEIMTKRGKNSIVATLYTSGSQTFACQTPN